MRLGTLGELTVCLTLVSLAAMAQDTTPPTPGTVWNRSGQNEPSQNYDDALVGTWTDFRDNESAIARYDVAVGTSPGCTDVEPFRSVGLVKTANWTLHNGTLRQRLTPGKTYFITVKGTNTAGLSSSGSSAGLLITNPDGTVPPGSDGGIPACPDPPDAGVPDGGTGDAGLPDAGPPPGPAPDGGAPGGNITEQDPPLGWGCGTAGSAGGLTLLVLVMLGLPRGRRSL